MSLDAWIAVAGIASVFLMLAATRVPPYLIILGGVMTLYVAGVLSPSAAFSGFANEGMMTVAALFIVAAGLNETGVVSATVHRFLGTPRTGISAQTRLIVPVTAASAFLNNTPIVAMLMPVVNDWSKRISVPASQLLIPLSYAAILGGMCTLIGTSTNLVVHGLLIESGGPGLGFFDITRVGLPCAVIGVGYLLLFSRRLLPKHLHALSALSDPREYSLEMIVEAGGPLAGRTIEKAGLRHLPGLFLAEIHRRGHVIAAVGPEEELEADDQLIFVGVVDSVIDLQQIPGLRPASEQLFKLDAPRADRWFVEAVVSRTCPIVGKTFRGGRFRDRYNAVIIGVARNGQRINRRIGDIVAQPGDVLLLEAHPEFVDQQRNSSDFYLVSRIEGASPPPHDRAWLAATITALMVLLATSGLLTLLQAAVAAAFMMIVTRCCSEEVARRRVDWQLLIAIAASFGLGRALADTGAAEVIATGILGSVGDSPILALTAVYGITMILSGLITNNATAVVVFPIAMATASELGVNPMPFIIAIMMAASASFATPLGLPDKLDGVWSRRLSLPRLHGHRTSALASHLGSRDRHSPQRVAILVAAVRAIATASRRV